MAFKRDCFGVDLICLLIGTEAATFEINEESIGWKAFLGTAQQKLPGMVAFEVKVWLIELAELARV